MARTIRAAASDPTAQLFSLPLTEFTAARNALAAVLKKGGRADEAATVKALTRPSVPAWAVNQLHWRHREELAELISAGNRFRQAQRAQFSGERSDIRAALDAWRAALAGMTTRAADLLREAGHQPTSDVMRRVASTLEALAAGAPTTAVPIGCLTVDLSPPGFEALTALIPRSGSGPRVTAEPRVIPFGGRTRTRKATGSAPTPAASRAAARKVVEEAKRALTAARTSARAAESEMKIAAARARLATDERDAAERQRAEVKARFERAAAAADLATKEAHRVARAAEDAAQAVTDAERRLEEARDALKSEPLK